MAKKTKKKEPPFIADRPAGPHDKKLESGLIYGRWYGGAVQNCGCFNTPEGIHHAGCKHGLCTSERAAVEAPEETREDEAQDADGT